MTVPKINSSHGSETRNIINRVIEVLNRLGIDVQTLVAEGQLTPGQYAELIKLVNGLIDEDHLNERLKDVASGSPKGAYTTLTDLQNAYPNGADGIYVVTENGNWYYYDGSEWQSGGVYQTTQWQNALTTQNEDWVI